MKRERILPVLAGRRVDVESSRVFARSLWILVFISVASLAGLPAVVHPAHALDADCVGYTSEPIPVTGGGTDECTGTLAFHHDETFESGYGWQYGGVEPPYYGCFAEGYALGPATVRCVVLWLTDLHYYTGGPCDVYIWEGGVTGPPGEVLSVTTDVDPGAPATFPVVSQHDVDINDHAFSGGELTVGYWGNWPGAHSQWFCGCDLDGPGGNPWTCLAPGSGYGTGWADPSIVWGATQSLGLGFYYEDDPTEVRAATWGKIKALF